MILNNLINLKFKRSESLSNQLRFQINFTKMNNNNYYLFFLNFYLKMGKQFVRNMNDHQFYEKRSDERLKAYLLNL